MSSEVQGSKVLGSEVQGSEVRKQMSEVSLRSNLILFVLVLVLVLADQNLIWDEYEDDDEGGSLPLCSMRHALCVSPGRWV